MPAETRCAESGSNRSANDRSANERGEVGRGGEDKQLPTDHSTVPGSTGELKLSGSMTRQQEQKLAWDGKNAISHLANMGRMIEDMENRMRDSLQDVYFGKTKSCVNMLYNSSQMEANKQALASSLQAEMARRNQS